MTDINMFGWEMDEAGIVTLTMDDPNQGANTMNALFVSSLAATMDRLEAEKEKINGVVVTSGKKTFFAGGDLHDLSQATPANAQQVTDQVTTMKALLRRLETFGRPVVAAINGSALGGGLEIALACHHRIALDAKGSKIGLPEVGLGLLPGGGGVVRTVRMFGIQTALMNHLLQGQQRSPKDAMAAGLVDEVVSTPEEMMHAAKTWALSNLEAVQPWDVKGYKIPGGTPMTPAFAANLPAFPANLRKTLKGAPMPAPHHIMAAAVEGAQVDFATAEKIETQYFVNLATGPVSKNMIQAFFFDMQHISKGGDRPKDVPKYTAQKVVVLGAGMMGAGIAYECARAGMEVVLKDMNLAAAEKGKAYSQGILDKAVARGKMTAEGRDEILARITPTENMADAKGADLMIEAVFEDPALKKSVYAEVVPLLTEDALLGSNTSSLPVTGLAEGVDRPEDFIGLHFFSPVDKMKLLEIVVGKQTSDEALAKAIDVAVQIRKLPIVVNDSRGFFTSRVIGTVVAEAASLVGEGVPANSVEQAALQAGLPGRSAGPHRRGEPDVGAEDQEGGRRGGRGRGRGVGRTPGLRRHREDGHRARPWRPGGRGRLLRVRRGQEARTVERAQGLLRRRQPRHPAEGPAGPDAVHRGDREHQVPRRERPAHRAGREHRLDLRHRVPGVDRWRAAVREHLRRRRPRGLRRAGQRAGAAAYGERFTPPASVVALAEAGGSYK